jgi:hypothetical protein
MKLLQLIAGVEFNGAAQDSFDLATLVAEQEVNEAIARREIFRSRPSTQRFMSSTRKRKLCRFTSHNTR